MKLVKKKTIILTFTLPHKRSLGAKFPLIIFLAEQNFSLMGGHFGHLSKEILYTRPIQRAQKKVCNF